MGQAQRSALLIAAFVLISIFVFGCSPTLVTIPDAANDHKPVITVHSLPSGPGRVSPAEVRTNAPYTKPVGVTEKTIVLITVDATNAGGVHMLSITGYKGGNKLWEAKVEVQPTADNKGPKTLSIIGHNGQGGIGSQPLYIPFDELMEAGYVKVDAYNFTSSQPEHLQVNYNVLPSNLVP